MVEEPQTYWPAAALETQVRAKYPLPAHVVLTEVRDSTGFSGAGREADALAFGLWPSRGLDVIGFEFKSSRSDWKSELANPAKAESIARYCDEWWLVAHDNVARLDEIPATWGWYAPTAKGLKVNKMPVRAADPKALTRPFVMAIMRNIDKHYVPQGRVNDLVEEKGAELADHRAGVNKRRLERCAELEKVLEDFHVASGIDLGKEWSYPEYPPKLVGVIVKALLTGDLVGHLEKVKEAALMAQEALDTIAALPFPLPTKKAVRR